MVRGQVMRRGVDAERVAVMEVVVEHRGEQVVRRRDRVEVAGEVEVDLVHRDHLRVAAARRAALHAEHRARATARGCRPRPSCRAGGAPAPRPTVTVVFPSPAGVGLMPGDQDEPALGLARARWPPA